MPKNHQNLNRKPYILIIDDEPDNFDVVEGFLFEENYYLSYASSAKKAFDRLEKHVPDLVLVDAMMPDIDGFSFCRTFKQSTQWAHIPVIMLTALGRDYLSDCLESGADDFVAKPINKAELKARIMSMLRMKFQYDELQRFVNFRNDLMSMVVHDFTNPLTTILLQAEILERLDLPPNINKGVQRMRRAANTLEDLRNDVLTYGKAESGSLVLDRKKFEIRGWLQSIIADFEGLATTRNVRLDLTYLIESTEQINGDLTLLSRTVNNLLSNALKFSPFDSTIKIQVELYQDEGQIPRFKLFVKDQGIGVSDELKKAVFQKYQIGQKHENIRQTGLGLAFCKMVVDAHSGEIYVLDNEPQGSIFVVDLPQLAPLSENI